LLGAGGLAFGGIAIAGYVFNVGPLAEITKIDINTIFGVENATKYMNDSSNRKNYYTPDDVYDGMIAYLNDLAKAYASGANADVMNDINVAKLNGVTVGEQILSAAVSVKPNSQKYSGNNFDLYVYNDKAFTRTLSNDFTNHDFNCVTNTSLSSFANSVNLTFGNILGSTGILKLLNSSLSLNDVVVQYYDNDGG
jgi:hypothetical protein